MQEKHKYRLIPSSRTSEKRIRLDRRAKNSLEAKKCNDYRIPSKSQNDREPQKTKHMTMKKAAVIEAIKAVAVAEIACAEAEKAAMLADEIEAEAEASVSLHKKLMKELENKTFRINLL
ncbi:hypothetical protein RIF29_20689 [Crotalaria pallida]|uniref:Uncharacterized protein n=1 Tax=Crotalaria pallida TaxID=3830 RepID=A0AAN9F1J9_CROPI